MARLYGGTAGLSNPAILDAGFAAGFAAGRRVRAALTFARL
jgi:hypothetical protein